MKFAPYLAGRSAPRILVDEIYLGVLGKPGDPLARAAAAKHLDEGRTTVLQIVQELLRGSHNTPQDRQRDFEATANDVYQAVLSRLPNAAERQRIVDTLERGAPLSRIILQVQATAEARRALFSAALADGGIGDLILAEVQRGKAKLNA